MTDARRTDGVGPLNLLWTGGWDSTFRLMSLITAQRCTVQPYYVVDRTRRSWPVELDTMHRILAVCRADAGARFLGSVLDPSVVEKEKVENDEEVCRGFRALRRRGYLGEQYIWLARFAERRGLSYLELAIHRDDRAHAFLDGHVERCEGPYGATYALCSGASEGLEIFRFFRFPLFDLTKREMAALAKRQGFEDVLDLTWFCYRPLAGGRACGTCNPCRCTIAEGLGRRVGWVGRMRYHGLLGRATARRLVPEGARRALRRALGRYPA